MKSRIQHELRTAGHGLSRQLIRLFSLYSVLDRRIAQEVKVGGDRKPEIDLPARIAADHTGLYVVQLLRAGRTVFQQGVVLSFERFVGVVFVEEEGQSRTYRSVEDRQLPILLVVDLSETGRYQRDPTYARQRDGIALAATSVSRKPTPIVAPTTKPWKSTRKTRSTIPTRL